MNFLFQNQKKLNCVEQQSPLANYQDEFLNDVIVPDYLSPIVVDILPSSTGVLWKTTSLISVSD